MATGPQVLAKSETARRGASGEHPKRIPGGSIPTGQALFTQATRWVHQHPAASAPEIASGPRQTPASLGGLLGPSDSAGLSSPLSPSSLTSTPASCTVPTCKAATPTPEAAAHNFVGSVLCSESAEGSRRGCETSSFYAEPSGPLVTTLSRQARWSGARTWACPAQFAGPPSSPIATAPRKS